MTSDTPGYRAHVERGAETGSGINSRDERSDVDRLLAVVEEQRREIDDLRARLDRIAPVGAGDASATSDGARSGPASSRRQMLANAGRLGAVAAGAGVAATLVSSQPVAADDGDPILIGNPPADPATNPRGLNIANSPTILESPSMDGAEADIFIVRDGPIFDDGVNRLYPAALGGHGVGNVTRNGIHGFASDNVPIADVDEGHPVVAQAGPNARSSILLTATAPDPLDVIQAHRTGELICDPSGDLWFCVDGGLPATFRRLAGVATAGAFVAIDPVRVYDSRFPNTGGRIFEDSDRVIPLRFGRDPRSYAVTTDPAVPGAVSAIAFNLTVLNTIGRGFLAIAPTSQTTIEASTINWGDTQDGPLANAGHVKVDGDRAVRVLCGEGSCNFILDVVGYYR